MRSSPKGFVKLHPVLPLIPHYILYQLSFVIQDDVTECHVQIIPEKKIMPVCGVRHTGMILFRQSSACFGRVIVTVVPPEASDTIARLPPHISLRRSRMF